jgi:rhodanese-related sulfurtransferase
MRRPVGLPVRLLLFAIAVVVVGACGAPGASKAPPPYAGVGPAPLEVFGHEADLLRGNGAFILDVREPDEWAAGHIEGATLIPLGQLAGRAGEVPTDRVVVVVCRSGSRSAEGRDILLEAGFERVTSMAGGMSEWIAAGRPVVTGP